MFLRKLTVIVVPLLLAVALCLVFPLLGGLGFFSNVLKGALLGIFLGLLLPLSGAGRKKEPFAVLLWLPALLMVLVIFYQYIATTMTVTIPVLSVLNTTNGQIVLVESAFAGYMLLTCIRTKR